MADAPDPIAEIKAEFEKMLAALQGLEPPWRMPSELSVLNKLRDFTDAFIRIRDTRG